MPRHKEVKKEALTAAGATAGASCKPHFYYITERERKQMEREKELDRLMKALGGVSIFEDDYERKLEASTFAAGAETEGNEEKEII